jgi:hypothetical protein
MVVTSWAGRPLPAALMPGQMRADRREGGAAGGTTSQERCRPAGGGAAGRGRCTEGASRDSGQEGALQGGDRRSGRGKRWADWGWASCGPARSGASCETGQAVGRPEEERSEQSGGAGKPEEERGSVGKQSGGGVGEPEEERRRERAERRRRRARGGAWRRGQRKTVQARERSRVSYPILCRVPSSKTHGKGHEVCRVPSTKAHGKEQNQIEKICAVKFTARVKI